MGLLVTGHARNVVEYATQTVLLTVIQSLKPLLIGWKNSMAQIIDLLTLADSVIANAGAKYSEIPTIFSKVDRKVLRRSLREAAGNIHRLTVEKDGSIIVWNRTVW
jgi:hypothetical protein